MQNSKREVTIFVQVHIHSAHKAPSAPHLVHSNSKQPLAWCGQFQTEPQALFKWPAGFYFLIGENKLQWIVRFIIESNHNYPELQIPRHFWVWVIKIQNPVESCMVFPSCEPWLFSWKIWGFLRERGLHRDNSSLANPQTGPMGEAW